jgi:aspartate--ammonia ligase
MKTLELKKTTYTPILSEYQTEIAIDLLKSKFASGLSEKLHLIKVEAPLLSVKGTGINDDLNGIESPVSVKIKDLPQIIVEVVQSLAKWKRLKLSKLKAVPGEGLFTDMRALRPDEDLSEVHSVYVDQWDWEKVIAESSRELSYLKSTVLKIYKTILEVEEYIAQKFPALKSFLPSEITFIHSEELQQRYPELLPKERENKIAKEKGAVFIIGIGAELSDGKKHDGRAPDYDDWSTETSADKKGLNGDIVVWNPVLKKAFEISSMGIRVSPESLKKQLFLCGEEDRLKLDWHKKLITGELPFTIGGGIGQSRLAMLLLQKKHIAEVQSSIWPEELIRELTESNVTIL